MAHIHNIGKQINGKFDIDLLEWSIFVEIICFLFSFGE